MMTPTCSGLLGCQSPDQGGDVRRPGGLAGHSGQPSEPTVIDRGVDPVGPCEFFDGIARTREQSHADPPGQSPDRWQAPRLQEPMKLMTRGEAGLACDCVGVAQQPPVRRQRLQDCVDPCSIGPVD